MEYAVMTIAVASTDSEKQKDAIRQYSEMAGLLKDGYQIQMSHMTTHPEGLLLFVYLTKENSK